MVAVSLVQVAAIVVGSNSRRSGKEHPDAHQLAPLAGRSAVGWAIDSLLGASVRRVGLVGLELAEDERNEFSNRTDKALIDCVENDRDIVSSVDRVLHLIGPDLTMSDSAHILIVSTTTPQITSEQLRLLTERHLLSGAAATVIHNPDPDGDSNPTSTAEPELSFNDDGVLQSILEPVTERPAEPIIGIVRASMLMPALRRVMPERWSRRLLLNDALFTLEESGHLVVHEELMEPVCPIKDGRSRAEVESTLRARIIAEWIDRGVNIDDPAQVSIDASAVIGQGVRLRPGSVVEGNTIIADGAIIGPNSHLVDASIGAGAIVPSSSVVQSEVMAHEVLAPFSVRHP